MTPQPVISVPPNAPQLTEENLRDLHAAATAMRRIKRTVSIATFDGWSIGIFAVLTWLCGTTDPVNIIMGLGMGAIAAVELTGAKRLRRLDPRAARMLALNQLALASLLIGYAVWRLFAVTHEGATASLLGAVDPEVLNMVGPIDALARQISLVLYGGVIAIALLGQGGMALYYATRAKMVAAYVTQTPPWIVEMQRAGFGV
jgi:hypothetical protein